jgi:hypothetical protein
MLKLPRILLIAPRFFGYELEIASELTRLGFEVDFLPDRPFNSPFIKAVMRFCPELGYYSCDQFFIQRIEKLGRSDYSSIIVIQGEGITANFLRQAKLIFYTWDSIENKPFSKRNLSMYDRCLTFDPVDAKKYGMFFRPLFYSDGFDLPTSLNYNYDLSFIGTVHSDRYKIVNSLLDQLPSDTRTFIYFYLQATWMYPFRRYFTKTIVGAKRNEFQFVPLSKDIVQATFFGSRAIIDIEHAQQRGATMRTIEALGSSRKIVTTNATLQNYDFYNPVNIQIIDRNRPRLNQNFLRIPYQAISEKIRHKYSLRQWVSDICDFGDLKE